MNILHITRDLLPRSVGGISGVVGGLLDESATANIDARAISFDAWRPNVRQRGSGAVLQTRNVLRLDGVNGLEDALAFARASEADVVHVHHESLWEYGASFARELGRPTVYTAHVLQWELNAFRGIDATRSSQQQAIALAEADVVTAPSRSAAEAVRHVSGREALLTYPGLAQSWLEAASPMPDATRPRLVCVGRWDTAKGTDRVLEAARLSAEAYGPLTLVLVGGVPENARAARRWHETFANYASDALQIETPGWLGSFELRHELDRATLLVQLSASETFGIAVLEGLARGVAVVASRRGLVAELAPDTMMVVEPNDTAAAAAGIVALLRNGQLREQYAARGQQAAHSFVWSRTLPGWVAAWTAAAQ